MDKLDGITTYLFVLTAVAVGLWEALRPRRRQSVPIGGRWMGAFALYVFNAVVVVALIGWLFPLTLDPGWMASARAWLGLPGWLSGSSLFGVVAGVLAIDFVHYWNHRAMHAVPALWRVHALHHSDPEVDVSTALRHHPLEHLYSRIVVTVALVAVGVPVEAGIVSGTLAIVVQFVHHGNVALPAAVQSVLAPIFVTPNMHRIHHSADPAEGNANYGSVFSFWDRVFATHVLRTEAEHAKMEFGVRELSSPRDQSFSGMLLTPLRAGGGL